MKILLIILFCCITLTSIAGERIVFQKVSYTILSDTFTNDLLSGQVRVKGHVLDYKGDGIAGTLVSAIDESSTTLTDLTGAYELIILDSDESIFIYKEGYEEVAIEPYGFREGHTVIIDFRPPIPLKIIDPADTPRPPQNVSYKPVIYLYSDLAIDVSLDLDYLGDLTFTYPVYNDGWNVKLNSKGISDPSTERAYPYLFWEGEMEGLTYEKEDDKLIGQLIATDTLVEFLEHQLTDMGLNRNEQTDFITFWAPKMSNSKYVFVQFLLDDLYTNKVAKLTVNPQPESMKRVYLLFTQFNELPTFETTPQKFESFQRNGFTLIEWGGSELNLNIIQL
jgi:hypothetical protein